MKAFYQAEHEKRCSLNPEGRALTKVKDKMSHPKATDLLALLKRRRSIREYQTLKPPISLVDRLIDCACYAPSAHNAQPWRFFIVEDENRREVLVSEMAKRYEKDLQRDKLSSPTIKRRLKRSKHFFRDAPLLIIACIDMSVMDKYPDVARRQAEMIMATQSLAAAIENLLLAATALGLGGCWFCAPLFCPDLVKTVLSLSEYLAPQALITLGYPAESPSPPPRLNCDDVRFIL